MSSPPPLHFGPTELAHLAELQRSIPPAELEPVAAHWAGQGLSMYMKPLAPPTKPEGSRRRAPADMEQLRNQYKAAIGVRGEFCKLFTGQAPFFLEPSQESPEPRDAKFFAQLAVDQSSSQINSWSVGHENWSSLYGALVQKPSDDLQAWRARSLFNGRPFIRLMKIPYCGKS